MVPRARDKLTRLSSTCLKHMSMVLSSASMAEKGMLFDLLPLAAFAPLFPSLADALLMDVKLLLSSITFRDGRLMPSAVA